MARRLGIQYVIWNKRIWGSYNASAGWRAYTGANKHTDHVHISFTWAGANMNTSFWTGRVGSVNWRRSQCRRPCTARREAPTGADCTRDPAGRP